MWLTSHPRNSIPVHAEHPSEAAAEQHAANLRAHGFEAVAFWSEGVEVAGKRATGAQGDERGEVAPESHDDATGPTGAVFERESA